MSTGYGNTSLSDVLYNQNKQTVYQYLREQKVKYIIMFDNQETQNILETGKEQKLALFDIIDDVNYFSHPVTSDKNSNLWNIYELKQ